MINIENQAPFPGQMFPPDPLIITLVCYNTLSIFSENPCSLGSPGLLSAVFLFGVSFTPHLTEMQIASDPPLGVKTHRVLLAFEAQHRAMLSLLVGKTSQVKCKECVLHWGILARLPFCSCQLECLDDYVLKQMITGRLYGADHRAAHGFSNDYLHLGAGFSSPQPFRFHRPVK